MILITPDETSSPLNEDIERLQTNLRGFARDIENLQERVQSGDVTDAETRKVFSDLRSWLRMAMETEKALAQQNRQRLEIDGDYGLQPELGDRVRITTGCDKQFATCRDKFSNILNYRGFPDIPPIDWVMVHPTHAMQKAGGSRR